VNKSHLEVLHEVRPMQDGLGGSAAAACDVVFRRIAHVNGQIGALTDVLQESAMQEARNLDSRTAQGLSSGRLGGWPIAIKDNIDTVPARCSAGLRFLQDRRPEKDAEVVALLRQEGAVIVGVAYTDSGAFGVTSPGVVNPIYPDRIAGGSSGGSAAAVAAGLCVAAVGTDTGGSIRIPAACCGIFGFKPTKGRVSTVGVRPLATSFDHVGVLSSSVARIREVCEVIDPGFKDLPDGSPTGTVVGVPAAFYADANDDVLEAMARTVGLLKDMGITIKVVELGTPDEIIETHLVLALTEAARAYEDASECHDLNLYPEVAQQGILLGQSYSATAHLRAMRHRDVFTARIEEALAAVDFLMLPTLPVSPPERSASIATLQGREMHLLQALIRYTAAFDQTGHPVIALPTFDAASPLPGSVQLVGRLNGDRQLLAFAERVEARQTEKSANASV
jgi:aspartyl-tRNA(Asn)/glutamyl-tRNA(Gln) amidotransferase subunit A